MSRYDPVGSEAECEPGSEGRVLANRLGVTDPDEMEEIELTLLGRLYAAVFGDEFADRRLTVADLKRWHQRWLGNVYAWAGEERSVNMAKDGFHFAAAAQIPALLGKFEKSCLAQYTPCREGDAGQLALLIAETHVEFILIHPFREGNGRIGRLLADVMAVQAGRGLLDYSFWDSNKQDYITAIQKGMDMDYEPMASLVEAALPA